MLARTDIEKVLTDAGLTRGDHLFVHSSLHSVGPVDGGADAIIDALESVVGSEGTLAMPAFNYTRPLPQPYFDIKNTAARTGALTEIFRNRPETTRSLHPTHSICAVGKRTDEFLANHLNVEAVGIDCPLDRIARAGGYILLLGVTHLANTTIHVGEAYAGTKKFFWSDPVPIAKVLMPDGAIRDHQLDCSASCSMAFNVVDYPLRKANQIIDVTIGNSESYLMKGLDVIDAVVAIINHKPDILLCNRPHCRPCVKTKEYMRRHDV